MSKSDKRVAGQPVDDRPGFRRVHDPMIGYELVPDGTCTGSSPSTQGVDATPPSAQNKKRGRRSK